MANADLVANREIETLIREHLGPDRLRSVSVHLAENEDGAEIAWIRVIYDAASGLTVDEMDRIVDDLWDHKTLSESVLPVVDFQGDSDGESFAAE